MPKKKRLTNVGFVRKIMEYSRYGALKQSFIIEAILFYSKHIASMKAEEFKTGLISAEAWIGIANETLGELKEQGYIKD